MPSSKMSTSIPVRIRKPSLLNDSLNALDVVELALQALPVQTVGDRQAGASGR